MANRNFSATISIGAKLEQSFKGVFGGVKRDIEALGKSVAAARGQRDIIGSVTAARSRFEGASQALSEAQQSVKLSRAYGDKADVRGAQKVEAAAMKQVLAERRALNELTAQAKAAGLNIKKLAEEEKRATEQLTKLESEMKKLQGKSDRIDSVGRAFKKMGDAAQHVGQRVEKAGAALSGARNRMLLVTAAATAAGFALWKLTKGFIDAEDNLADTAEALNITTGSLKQWQVMAATVGVGDEKLNKAFSKFSANIAEGGDKTIEVLNELGISQAKLKGLPLGQQIAIVADKFKNYSGQMNQAAMVQKLFGKGATNLSTVFHMGRSEWDGYLERAKRFGYILDKEGKAKVDSMASSMDTLDLAFKGTRNTVALGLAPAITKVGEAITKFLEEHNDDIQQWAQDFGQRLESELLPAMKDFLTGLPDIARKFGEFAGGVWKVVSAVKDLTGGWGGLAAALTIANFTPVFAAFGPWGLAVEAVGIAVLALYNNWDTLTSKAQVWGDKVGSVFIEARESIGREMDAAFERIKTALDPAFKWIGDQFNAISQKIESWIVTPLEKAFNFAKGIFSSNENAASGKVSLQPREPISQEDLGKLRLGGMSTNHYNINVNAPGANGDEIANKIRNNLKLNPLNDGHGVLVPN
jgi:uncharacterized protein YoxC